MATLSGGPILSRSSSSAIGIGSWLQPRFYTYALGSGPDRSASALLYVKQEAWGESACQVSACSVFLAKHLELLALSKKDSLPLRGSKVLEFGDGCGLLAMVASLLGAASSTVVGDGSSLKHLRHNASAFNAEFTRCAAVRVCALPGFGLEDSGVSDALGKGDSFDIFLLGDCMFDPRGRVRALTILAHYLTNSNEALLARNTGVSAEENEFLEDLKSCVEVRLAASQQSIRRQVTGDSSSSLFAGFTPDSAVDISCSTEDDGSIEVLSLRARNDLPEKAWKAALQSLLEKSVKAEEQRDATDFARGKLVGDEDSAVAFAVKAAEGVRSRLKKALEGMTQKTSSGRPPSLALSTSTAATVSSSSSLVLGSPSRSSSVVSNATVSRPNAQKQRPGATGSVLPKPPPTGTASRVPLPSSAVSSSSPSRKATSTISTSARASKTKASASSSASAVSVSATRRTPNVGVDFAKKEGRKELDKKGPAVSSEAETAALSPEPQALQPSQSQPKLRSSPPLVPGSSNTNSNNNNKAGLATFSALRERRIASSTGRPLASSPGATKPLSSKAKGLGSSTATSSVVPKPALSDASVSSAIGELKRASQQTPISAVSSGGSASFKGASGPQASSSITSRRPTSTLSSSSSSSAQRMKASLSREGSAVGPLSVVKAKTSVGPALQTQRRVSVASVSSKTEGSTAREVKSSKEGTSSSLEIPQLSGSTQLSSQAKPEPSVGGISPEVPALSNLTAVTSWSSVESARANNKVESERSLRKDAEAPSSSVSTKKSLASKITGLFRRSNSKTSLPS